MVYTKEKAVEYLSRAEINLAGAGEVLQDRNLDEIKGEVEAVNTILRIIRDETNQSMY